MRTIVPSLIVDGVCPFLTYKLLRTYSTSVSEVVALALGALFPATKGIVELWRRRRLDFIGLIVLTGIAVGMVVLLVGRSPRAFLLRESFVTGTLGLLALSSFAWQRPLLFYVSRQFAAGQDPVGLDRFNGLWQRPEARKVFRLLTLVWALGWLGECSLKVVMVLTLSTAQVLAVSPFVFTGITVGLIAWTLSYVRRQRRRQSPE